MSEVFQLEEIKGKIVAFEKKAAVNPGDPDTERVLAQLYADRDRLESVVNPAPVIVEPAPVEETVLETEAEAEAESEGEGEGEAEETIKPIKKKKN